MCKFLVPNFTEIRQQMLKVRIEIYLFPQVNYDFTKLFSRNSQLFNNTARGSSLLNFTEVRRNHEENRAFHLYHSAKYGLYCTSF